MFVWYICVITTFSECGNIFSAVLAYFQSFLRRIADEHDFLFICSFVMHDQQLTYISLTLISLNKFCSLISIVLIYNWPFLSHLCVIISLWPFHFDLLRVDQRSLELLQRLIIPNSSLLILLVLHNPII